MKIKLTQSLITITLLFSGATLAMTTGSIAVYSDGTAEKLIQKNTSSMVWEDLKGRHITRSHNPLLPSLSRKSFLGTYDYRYNLQNGNPDKIFKEKSKKSVEFSLWRTDKLGNGKNRLYQCNYQGQDNILIEGHSEKTERYQCERFTIHRKFWTKEIKETRTIQYSPRLNMVVKTEKETLKSASERSLVKLIAAKEYRYKDLASLLQKIKKSKNQKNN